LPLLFLLGAVLAALGLALSSPSGHSAKAGSGDAQRLVAILQYLESDYPAAVASQDAGDIDIEWQTAKVELWVMSSGRRTAVAAQSAIVHEPLAQLYEGLPLARTDPKSRRFWRRVFWLVRIPGGRLLLAAVARRTRARH